VTRTSIQVSGNTPTFPAQWSYGLCRAHPGDEFCFCHRRWRIKADRTGWPDFASASLTSATDARPTRFCRTRRPSFVSTTPPGTRRSSARCVHSRASPPCDHNTRPTLPRPPQPAPRRDDGRRPSERDRMAGVVRVIWGRGEAECFFGRDWTGGISLIGLRKLGGARGATARKLDRFLARQTSYLLVSGSNPVPNHSHRFNRSCAPLREQTMRSMGGKPAVHR
jgi:hypothetical protein